jgi:hypothetical protein
MQEQLSKGSTWTAEFLRGLLYRWNLVNVELAFEYWHHVDVGCVTEVSEEHATCINEVEVRNIT